MSRHTAYNLLGSVMPIGLSLLTVPAYLAIVGPDRYGVLAIVWLLLGYFGLFDLGLGRATVFRIASLKAAAAVSRAAVFWTAILVNIAMGVVGGLILWLAAGYLFQRVFGMDAVLRPEALSAVPLIALSVPIATLNGVLIGAMQGRERFLELNVISVVSTALFQLLPLSVAWASGPALPHLVAAALFARLVTAASLGWRSYQELAAGFPISFDRREASVLLRYGGWVSLTSLLTPLLLIVDRFAIGAALGARAVAEYTVPYQLATRIQILPGALMTALKPRLSGATRAEQSRLVEMAGISVMGLLLPVFVGAIFVIGPFLQLWVGRDLGPDGGAIGRVVLLGMWANAFALIAYHRLEASGRPGTVTKIQAVEIPPYFLLLYLGMTYFGLLGAAYATALRSVADFILLNWTANGRAPLWRNHAAPAGMLLTAVFLASIWTIGDWQWWLAATLVTTSAGLWGLHTLPLELRQHSDVGRLEPLFDGMSRVATFGFKRSHALLHRR